MVWALLWRSFVVLVCGAALATSATEVAFADERPDSGAARLVYFVTLFAVLAVAARIAWLVGLQVLGILRTRTGDWRSIKNDPPARAGLLWVSLIFFPLTFLLDVLEGARATPGADAGGLVLLALTFFSAWVVVRSRQTGRAADDDGSHEDGSTRSRARLLVPSGAFVALMVGSLVFASPSNAEEAVIQRVVDGDTVEVVIGDRRHRVRLLNIDTPETNAPGGSVECLGEEATRFTESLLRRGEAVTLEFDGPRTDRYGRLLAHVVLEDGRNVSQEIARRGLGNALEYEASRRFEDVRAALVDASEAQVGYFDPEVPCTLAAMNEQIMPVAEQVAAADHGSTTAEAVAAAALTAAALETLNGLDGAARREGWLGRSVYRTVGRTADLLLFERTRTSAAERSEAFETTADERRAEDEARAAEKRAREAALDDRLAQLREEAERSAAARSPEQGPAPSTQDSSGENRSDSSGGDTADPYPGYTGPRCYAPGGKTWRPC